MSKEKQIEEMKKDLCECHTIDEWAAREYGEAYTDFDATAEKMLDRGWIKQSEGEWLQSDIPQEKYVCSVCGGACWYYDYHGYVAKSRYCPNCGAKMKGVSNEN